MGRVLVLFTILCSVLVVETAVDIDKKKVLLKKFSMCKGKENLPMQWKNIQAKNTAAGETFVHGQVIVISEVSTNLSIKFNFWKCDASGNPDSCEYILKDYLNTEICEYMGMQDELWTVFIDSFDKKPLCPIKPDTYTIVKLPISSSFMKYLPVNDALWRVKMEGYDNGNDVSCVELDMQIVPFLRNRNSKRNRH